MLATQHNRQLFHTQCSLLTDNTERRLISTTSWEEWKTTCDVGCQSLELSGLELANATRRNNRLAEWQRTHTWQSDPRRTWHFPRRVLWSCSSAPGTHHTPASVSACHRTHVHSRAGRGRSRRLLESRLQMRTCTHTHTHSVSESVIVTASVSVTVTVTVVEVSHVTAEM